MKAWVLSFLGLAALLMVIVSVRAFKLWVQSRVMGAPIGFFRILGMPLRKINAALIVNEYTKARKAGVSISVEDLENHYLANGNVTGVVVAMIRAKMANIQLDFAKAASNDLAGRAMEPLP